MEHSLAIWCSKVIATHLRHFNGWWQWPSENSLGDLFMSIFVFSNSITEHENHLKLVFDQLQSFSFYLQESKCQLYALVMDCLGHRIDDQGLHCDTDKLARIQNWREPRTYLDVQRFLGLVQYLSHFLPDISAYTGPLATMVRNGKAFEWRPLHQSCFDAIKAMTAKTLILKPVDPLLNEPIWLICDASVSGIGAMYGQGPTWQQCWPVGFMSKKFTLAQHHYCVFELETLGILEGLLKWEDKLLCIRIHVVTDHKFLEFFKNSTETLESSIALDGISLAVWLWYPIC